MHWYKVTFCRGKDRKRANVGAYCLDWREEMEYRRVRQYSCIAVEERYSVEKRQGRVKLGDGRRKRSGLGWWGLEARGFRPILEKAERTA